ncbi:Hypothetical protein KVN_LOCUS119 [uncultured virus]|nr:Hypothetical protein KVN_LOCUS119 [uncultured virus]
MVEILKTTKFDDCWHFNMTSEIWSLISSNIDSTGRMLKVTTAFWTFKRINYYEKSTIIKEDLEYDDEINDFFSWKEKKTLIE